MPHPDWNLENRSRINLDNGGCRCTALSRQPNRKCQEVPWLYKIRIRGKTLTDKCAVKLLENHSEAYVPEVLQALGRALVRYAKERPQDEEGLRVYRELLGQGGGT